MRPDYTSRKMHASTTAARSTIHNEMLATIPSGRTIAIYENEIPEFAGAALERLYCNIYCTIRRFALYDSLAGVNTYVVVDDGVIETLILFRIVGRAAYVLNQQIQLRTEHIIEFSNAIFARFRTVARIEFYALDATIDPARFPLPFQMVPRLQEQIVKLPQTEEMYIQHSEARSIRKWRKMLRKLHTEHSTYRFEVLRREEIRETHIRTVVGLADKRMQSKHKATYVSEFQIGRFGELALTHGLMGLIYIDEEIRAGVLCYVAGDRCFVQLIGHDPQWNHYALGNIVQFQMIVLCIREGLKEVLMMGGNDEAKARFLAQRKILYSISIYRPGFLLSCNWKRYLGNQAKVMVHNCKQLVKHKTTEAGLIGKTLASLIVAARTARAAGRKVLSSRIAG